MTVPALVNDGDVDVLPHGRHRATLQEVEVAFVADPCFASSSTRAAVWAQFSDATAVLQSAIRVHAVWLSGSFLTAKLDPGDIDAVFLVSARDYSRATDDDKKIVDSFVLTPGPLGTPVRNSGFDLVDSYILNWRPFPELNPLADNEQNYYCATRGYWDDFWQRTRKGAKGAPATWKDGVPARGYLEVELDAFDR